MTAPTIATLELQQWIIPIIFNCKHDDELLNKHIIAAQRPLHIDTRFNSIEERLALKSHFQGVFDRVFPTWKSIQLCTYLLHVYQDTMNIKSSKLIRQQITLKYGPNAPNLCLADIITVLNAEIQLVDDIIGHSFYFILKFYFSM